MSLIKNEDSSNEFNYDKLLSIKPKKKLIRNIYNISNVNKNKNNKDLNYLDTSILTESDTETEKSSNEIYSDEISMNSTLYKTHELKAISVVSDLTLTNTQKKYISHNLKEYNENSIINMDISDDEEIEININKNELKKSFLPCRQEEQNVIFNYIKNGLKTNGSYNSLYICGMTGTGKTESVNRVIEIIEKENNENNGIPFRKLFINCINFDSNEKLIKCIYSFIFSNHQKNMKVSKYLNILDSFFSKRNNYNGNKYLNDPTNSHIILIIDEIDYLINKFQLLLYHIFNWSLYPNSKLIIISISNIININQLFLSKIESRFGQNKLLVKPYTKEQIREIINYKEINLKLFDEDALKLTSMKVAAINGDLRRVILILKRAIEIHNNEINNNKIDNQKNLINKFYIIKACNDLFDNKIINIIKNLKILEKIVIGAILYNINKNYSNCTNLENIYDTVDLLLQKYNEFNMEKGKLELDINWEEFKNIIHNMKRIGIIKFLDNDITNFKDNLILIKFYVDEFSVACESDEDFRPVYSFLMNSIN